MPRKKSVRAELAELAVRLDPVELAILKASLLSMSDSVLNDQEKFIVDNEKNIISPALYINLMKKIKTVLDK